jgi:hypothetical protein
MQTGICRKTAFYALYSVLLHRGYMARPQQFKLYVRWQEKPVYIRYVENSVESVENQYPDMPYTPFRRLINF